MIAGTEALTWVLQRLAVTGVGIVGLIYVGWWLFPREGRKRRKTLKALGFRDN